MTSLLETATSPSEFGRTLRRLRKERQITGKTLADATGFSQPKISKIETGKVLPTFDDLVAIADALNLGSVARAELIDALERLQTDLSSLRLMRRRGVHWKQDEIRHVETTTATYRSFQTLVIPGLLQTAEYARTLFRLLGVTDTADLARAVASRVERQQVLYDESKTFHFLVTEGALRARYLDSQGHRIQIATLNTLATLPNVHVRIVPLDQQLRAVPSNDFIIFDDKIVSVETLTNHLMIRAETEIEMYSRVHSTLWDDALSGERRAEFLHNLELHLSR